MSHQEFPRFEEPTTERIASTPRSSLFTTVIGAAALGIGSLSLASNPSFQSTLAGLFATSSDSAEPDLLLDDDGFEPISTGSAPAASTNRRTAVRDRDENLVERAVHVTMTDVAEEIVPVEFETPEPPAPAKFSLPGDAAAGVWLTGAIEAMETAGDTGDQQLPEIPAWRRRSKSLKARPAAPRKGSPAVKD